MDNENTVMKPAAEQPSGIERTRSGRCYRPNVDILEQNDELLVMADVPGAKKDSIDVKFENGLLEIYASVTPRDCGCATPMLREYGVGDFYRTFQVSESIDAAKISAQYADGVLTLRMPKAEAAKPRKIDVNA